MRTFALIILRNKNNKSQFNTTKFNVKLTKASVLMMTCVSMFYMNASFAITPTQQAVANYFANSVCTPGIIAAESSPIVARSLSNNSVRTNNINAQGYNTANYDCSSLSGTALFQNGIENMLNNGSTVSTNNFLSAIAFEEVITMGTLNVEINGAQMNHIVAHVAGLHQGGLGMRYPSLPAQKLAQSGTPTGGAASGSVSNKNGMGFFVNTRIDTGEKDETSIESGFDFNAYGITGGMDIRLNNQFVLGLAAGYGKTKADYTNSVGTMDMDGYSLSVFGTFYKKDRYYIDGIVNLTRNNFDSSRTFTDTNGTVQTANANTDGDILNVGLGFGYEYHNKDITIGPFAKLNYTRVDIDGFTETGAGPWGLIVNGQRLSSFEGVVGMQVSKTISKPWGVLIPQVRLELVHEFDNESRIINAQYIGAVQNGINTLLLQPTDVPDENYFNLSISAATQLSHGRSAYAQYTALLGQKNLSEHALELGVRWDY